jgi:hypothetical protein
MSSAIPILVCFYTICAMLCDFKNSFSIECKLYSTRKKNTMEGSVEGCAWALGRVAHVLHADRADVHIRDMPTGPGSSESRKPGQKSLRILLAVTSRTA